MEFVKLQERPADWDSEIRRFSSRTLFHDSAWLDFVLASRPNCSVDYYRIRRGGTTAGYFCAVRTRKLVFTMYGSPLPGTGMYLGPVVDGGLDQAELIHHLVKVSRARGIASLEMANDWLDPDLMRGFGFTVTSGVTHVCPLTDELSVWNAMRGTCRTRIRKAEKGGLTAEVTDDEGIVDQFYRYLAELLPRRKGKTPDYDIRIPRSLMSRLSPADRVFPVRVKHEGKVIGAAFYPHDDQTMYYWDGASDPDALHLCPNELLHWTAMKEGMRRGLTRFNMGGAPEPSRFTRKFGGRDVPYHVFRRSFIPFLETARGLYHRLRYPQAVDGGPARADWAQAGGASMEPGSRQRRR